MWWESSLGFSGAFPWWVMMLSISSLCCLFTDLWKKSSQIFCSLLIWVTYLYYRVVRVQVTTDFKKIPYQEMFLFCVIISLFWWYPSKHRFQFWLAPIYLFSLLFWASDIFNKALPNVISVSIYSCSFFLKFYDSNNTWAYDS